MTEVCLGAVSIKIEVEADLIATANLHEGVCSDCRSLSVPVCLADGGSWAEMEINAQQLEGTLQWKYRSAFSWGGANAVESVWFFLQRGNRFYSHSTEIPLLCDSRR